MPLLSTPTSRRSRCSFSVALAASLAASIAGCSGASPGSRGVAVVAAAYVSRVDAAWSPPAAVADLYAAARAGGAQASRELAPDAALGETAQALAERVAHDPQHRPPPARLIQALAWQAGVIDPVPAVVVMASTGAVNSAELSSSVAEMARDGAYNVVGAGRAAHGGSTVVVVAIAQRRVTLNAPVPRRVAPGARVQLNGALAAGLRNPELAITHPDGRGEHFPLGEGPSFVGQFPASARGAYQVELLAEGEGGTTVIANFPVYAGVDPPTAFDALGSTATETPQQAEAALLALVNEARRAAGRRPVELMPALSDVARRHSQDMATNHFVAHISRTSGTPADRLRAAGLQSGRILENLGRGYNAREIHDGLMASPGHRSNILNEHVTHVGFGAAVETGAGGGLVVTENFIEVASAVDVGAAPAQLLEGINRARTARGAPALAARPQLAEVAQNTAREFFAGEASQQAVVDRANRQLTRFGLLFRRIEVFATVVTRISDAGSLEPLMNPAASAIGIGVAQGTRRDTPPNAIFVVYVLGYPR